MLQHTGPQRHMRLPGQRTLLQVMFQQTCGLFRHAPTGGERSVGLKREFTARHGKQEKAAFAATLPTGARSFALMLRFSALLLSTTALLHAETCACTIPVFRYALDRWEADKFHLVLPASAAQDTALTDALRPLRANGKANLDITTSKDPAVTTAILNPSRESDRPVWTGALDKATLDALLDSPARRQILDHILAGDSAIWVIVESGSAEDKAASERIEKRLKFLEQVAALPIQDPNDPDSQLGPGPPLKLKFTTLRLQRGDPAEKVLLPMLAGPKHIVDPATTSFAAAVFGKGRVLGAWPLSELDDTALEEASMFLVGRCGCRIKNENPGWDLLLNVDWEKALQAAGEPKEVSAKSADTTKPETVITQAVAAPEAVHSQPAPTAVPSRAGSSLMIGAAALLAAAAFFLLRGGHKK